LTRINGSQPRAAENACACRRHLPEIHRSGHAAVKPIIALLMCMSSILLPGRAFAADPLQQLLVRVASVYGPAPGAIRESGTTFSALEGEGSLLRLTKFPDQFHIEIAYAAASDERTMIGARAWNKRAPANPMSRGAIVLQATRVALPWSLLSRQSSAIDRGTASEPDGTTVQLVEVPLEETLRMLVDIDPRTGYIVRSRGIAVIGGTAIEFATLYSDFRTEGGRVHAAREEQFAAGAKTGYSFIDKVEYLDTLPDGAFAPWASADSGQAATYARYTRDFFSTIWIAAQLHSARCSTRCRSATV